MVIEEKTERRETTRESTRRRLPRLLWMIPLVLTAMLAASFLYQAKFDDQFQFYPYAWHAHWMQSPFPNSEVTCFRKTVDVDGPVKSAFLIVSGDNFYTLYVNGKGVRPYFGTQAQATYVSPITFDAMGE